MTKYIKTILSVAIHHPVLHPIFGEGVTKVSIEDEAGGFFLRIKQEEMEIRMDMEELEEVVKAARVLIKQERK